MKAMQIFRFILSIFVIRNAKLHLCFPCICPTLFSLKYFIFKLKIERTHFSQHYCDQCDIIVTSLIFFIYIFPVCILLNATGNVPIIKKRSWTVDPYKTVSWIQKFIHKYLKLDPSEQIVSLSIIKIIITFI